MEQTMMTAGGTLPEHLQDYIPETIRPIEIITAEIQLYKQQAGVAILEIGRRLNEAKVQLSHGEWEPWLKEKVEFSEATARRFMRLAREYENQSLVTDLGTSKALILLALPASEREDFVSETHLVDGEEKTVFEMSKRELENAIKERDTANSRVIELEAEVSTLAEERLELECKCAAADMRIEEMKLQLEEEKNKPVTVAVEYKTDETAIEKAEEAARQKAVSEFETKLKKAEQYRRTAEQKQAEAEQKYRALEQERVAHAEQMKWENSELEKKLMEARKQLAAASSEVSVFKLHFEQVQHGINSMADILDNLAIEEKTEDSEKLRNALRALLQASLDALEV